jgi:preprotein translocase subunit YajC
MEGSGIGQFIPLILIFVIFYFFLNKTSTKKS